MSYSFKSVELVDDVNIDITGSQSIFTLDTSINDNRIRLRAAGLEPKVYRVVIQASFYLSATARSIDCEVKIVATSCYTAFEEGIVDQSLKVELCDLKTFAFNQEQSVVLSNLVDFLRGCAHTGTYASDLPVKNYNNQDSDTDPTLELNPIDIESTTSAYDLTLTLKFLDKEYVLDYTYTLPDRCSKKYGTFTSSCDKEYNDILVYYDNPDPATIGFPAPCQLVTIPSNCDGGFTNTIETGPGTFAAPVETWDSVSKLWSISSSVSIFDIT